MYLCLESSLQEHDKLIMLRCFICFFNASSNHVNLALSNLVLALLGRLRISNHHDKYLSWSCIIPFQSYNHAFYLSESCVGVLQSY